MEKKIIWRVRVMSSGEKSATVRETQHDTKRKALDFIDRLGELSMISRTDKIYVVMPKTK